MNITEQVKKDQNIRHPLQVAVLYTMNVYCDFITDENRLKPEQKVVIEDQMEEMPSPELTENLVVQFDEELKKYHTKVREYVPELMMVISGREKPDLLLKF